MGGGGQGGGVGGGGGGGGWGGGGGGGCVRGGSGKFVRDNKLLDMSWILKQESHKFN